MDADELARIRRFLFDKASLFEHPWDYRAGVEDAVNLLRAVVSKGELPDDRLATTAGEARMI